MEAITQFICENAPWAHLMIFSLLIIAGFNLPISEDCLLLSGGMIAATCIPDHTLRMFFWIYIGCVLSAWESYWLGRWVGPKLYDMRFFKHAITRERVGRLSLFYEKYGIWTFIIGRYCPGGVRNALFMSSGLSKMPFPKFIYRDGVASFFSTTVLFTLGYTFGHHWKKIIEFITFYQYFFFAILAFAIVVVLGIYFYRKKYKK